MAGRYLTTDIWTSESAYQAFQQGNRDRYRELDAEFEAFTASEKMVGHFEVVE